jgi:uncharacterized iron-regulated membrane protein
MFIVFIGFVFDRCLELMASREICHQWWKKARFAGLLGVPVRPFCQPATTQICLLFPIPVNVWGPTG